VLVAVSAFLTACHLPCPCDPNHKDLPGKTGRVAHFKRVENVPAEHAHWTVLQSRKRHGPPVVILPELPAVSSNLLDLARRVEEDGFTVYVPVMWGSLEDDATSKATVASRAVSLGFGGGFNAAWATADRPALADLVSFCRTYVEPRHRDENLGMIGNCITGSFPFSAAAALPRLAAPVGSQPSIPTLRLTPGAAGATGLSARETNALQARAKREGERFQLMAFRFEGDGVSTGARFGTYGRTFGKHFIGYQLPEALYVEKDGLPKRAHTVLTGCYKGRCYRSTWFAWEEMRRFLHAKLDSSEPAAFRPDKIPRP
jgi:dienelactone hydrolase